MEYINDTYANHMLIRLGYDIALRLPFPTAVIYVLHVHPARKGDLVGSEDFRIEPELSIEEYFDGFGNHCAGFAEEILPAALMIGKQNG